MPQSLATRRDSIICGLENLGNSCYANVIIQVLVNQTNFIDALSHCRVALNDSGSVAHSKSLKSFADLVESMERNEYVAPSNFLADAVSLNPGDFSVTRQGDASEFLLVLLSKWEEVFTKKIYLDKVYNSQSFYLGDLLFKESHPKPPVVAHEMFMLKLFKQKEDVVKSTLPAKRADSLRLGKALNNVSRRLEVPEELLRGHDSDLSRILLSRKNFITDLFQGCAVTVFTCMECQSSRISYPENFIVLSLPICAQPDLMGNATQQNSSTSSHSKKGQLFSRCRSIIYRDVKSDTAAPLSLIDCMKAFCSASITDFGEPCMQCSFCDRMQDKIEQRSFFLHLPEILIVSFKRFSFDASWISSRGYGSKKKDYVHCPMTLDLGNFCASLEYLSEGISAVSNGKCADNRCLRNDNIYTLDSIINHHGESLLKGHYTCYAYKPDVQKWSLFNDRHVGEVSSEEVSSSEVYIAVYKKILQSQHSNSGTLSGSSGATRHHVIRLLPSMKVEVSEGAFCDNADDPLAAGIELIRDICHVIKGKWKFHRNNDPNSCAMNVPPEERLCQSENVFSIPDSSLKLPPKDSISAGSRLLSIDWLLTSYTMTFPGPITNLPCYCCPGRPGQTPTHRHSPPASQMDQVFSSLCEYIKMTDIDKSIKASDHSYYQYFRGEKRHCHGMSISEIYVEVSVGIFTMLQSVFGGGPEIQPSDLPKMMEC